MLFHFMILNTPYFLIRLIAGDDYDEGCEQRNCCNSSKRRPDVLVRNHGERVVTPLQRVQKVHFGQNGRGIGVFQVQLSWENVPRRMLKTRE
ncbi:hypothetical protein niasHS_007904 [Heterodera schachtii]|uniref:Uncharacterized protein n=1 Tax=Heterodera schachtii TaxID=97005 RepID=A0ABD2JQ71_HETSC